MRSTVVLLVVALLGLSMDKEPERGLTPGGARPMEHADPEELIVLGAPPIHLDAEPDYWLGFPMIVAVTVSNPTEERTWYRLPGGDLLDCPGPVEFVFHSAQGIQVELPSASLGDHEEPHGSFTLRPGESRTMLLDLSGYDPELTPGAWRLNATYRTTGGPSSDAAPISLKIMAPSREDAAGARALMSSGTSDDPSWSRFLGSGTEHLPDVDLSPEAWRRLAFHEALQRIVASDRPIGDSDPAIFDGFDAGPLAGEASLLRYEIMRAHDAKSAAPLRQEIVSRTPGLTWRVERIDAGNGGIARLRSRR